MNEHDDSILNGFREFVGAADPDAPVEVVYRVTGGAPGERLEEEVRLSASGATSVRVEDELGERRSGEAASQIDPAAALGLLQAVEQSLGSLMAQSEARFPPDALVGSITVEVDGETTTLYFDADEESLAARELTPPKELDTLRQSFSELEDRILGAGDEAAPD